MGLKLDPSNQFRIFLSKQTKIRLTTKIARIEGCAACKRQFVVENMGVSEVVSPEVV